MIAFNESEWLKLRFLLRSSYVSIRESALRSMVNNGYIKLEFSSIIYINQSPINRSRIGTARFCSIYKDQLLYSV
jgi:hypothetical protein